MSTGTESASRKIAAVVPTLGRSPHLATALAALRREGGERLLLIVVWQGAEEPLPGTLGLADRVLRSADNLGFAAATNLGIEAAPHCQWIAAVNDDLVVEPGWLAALEAPLADPRVASVQGVNLQLERPELVDGCGLAWNRWWQAVQLGRGKAAPRIDAPAREIFGVSATGALFRRAALSEVALAPGAYFDPRLLAYYEDVDLAARLRATGRTALLVPRARAFHAGSTTGATLGLSRWSWLYGNRWLVLARLFGRGFCPRVPLFFLRDAADLANPRPAPGAGQRAAGILAGWARAARHLPHFARWGQPLVPSAELARFRVP